MEWHLGYRPGCIGQVVALHATYYAKRAGFGLPFEARVASGMVEFLQRFDAQRDGLWLCLDDEGHLLGSIAIDGLHHADEGAHLRWFIVADGARGQGLGRRLIGSAMDFCAQRGYRRVFLWTFEGLDAARHLYEQHGFRLDLQQPGSQWGREVNEQRFVRG